MVRLTREVRFGIDQSGEVVDGGNGFAGRPALTGVGSFLVLRLTLVGEVDPASGYLRNIKDIDAAVRKYATPALVKPRWMHQSAPRYLKELIEVDDGLPGANIVASELLLSPYLSLGWKKSEPDMICLSQKFEFSAAHRLHNPQLSAEENISLFGKCNNPHGHGHNYELQVSVKGVPDAKTGRLIAVDELERLVGEHVIDAFDHKHLNLEVPEFQSVNPSVENIAAVIYRRLEPVLNRTQAKLDRVVVWETPKTWAEVSAEGMRAEG